MRLFLGIIVFLIWASIFRYGYMCVLKKHCDPVIEADRDKTLDLILDDTITYLKGYDQFVFKKDEIKPDLNDNNKEYLDSLASVLKSDTAIFLTITGLYRPSEAGKNASIYEDFGKARANETMELLVQRGVSRKRLSPESKLGDGEELIQPLEFLLYSNRGETPEEYVTAQFRFHDMNYSDANFEKDSPIFVPGEALKTYADSVKIYFELNPNDTLTIIGHCDVDGTDEYNLELGKGRAESAKAYFMEKLGITSTIITLSKGESEQLTLTDTDPEVIKQKNRRVRFLINERDTTAN